MSYFLERLNFFKSAAERFADGHGQTRQQDRSWENSYRQRWQYDKIVRSTHGVHAVGKFTSKTGW